MAEILGLPEDQVAAFELEGMPGVSIVELPGLVTVKRYDTGLVIDWYVQREARRQLAH